MAKIASIGLRVEPELKEQLYQAAKEENRSVANLIETVMREWLMKRSAEHGDKTK